MEIIIPPNIIDVWFRLQVLLGSKLSGPTNTLREPSNLTDDFYKGGEIQNEHQYRNALDEFKSKQMDLPSKTLERIAFKTKPKLEEHMLIFLNKTTLEKFLSQPLQTIKKTIYIAVTFLTGSNSNFNVTTKYNKTFCTPIKHEDFN